jgi:excisionase family DNA binding protein
MPEKQRFLTIAEAAEFLHVSETSLRRWTNSGKLHSFRVGGRNERRFLMDDLLAFMPSAGSQPALSKQRAAEIQVILQSQSHQRHICLFFLNPDEQWQMLRPYILEYLNAQVPVLYIQESALSSRLLELLRAEGLPLEELIARGLLRLLPPAQTYLLGGGFDSQRMLSFIEAAILGALAAAYTRILIIGEMTWSLEAGLDAEQLKSYEAQLNPIVEKYPAATIVCQYDLRRFDGPGVLDALLTHLSVHLSLGRVPGFYGLDKAGPTS